MKCKSCKMNLSHSWKSCPNCGAPADQKAAQPEAPQAQPYKKLINILLLAGIVLYIVLKLRS